MLAEGISHTDAKLTCNTNLLTRMLIEIAKNSIADILLILICYFNLHSSFCKFVLQVNLASDFAYKKFF